MGRSLLEIAMFAATTSFPSSTPKDLHAAFLAIVPKIEMRARIAFALCKCANQKADRVAEAVALAWKWFVKLQERGKDAATFPGVFAILVARAVASGRRIAGGETINDVMSRVAQRKHGFSVQGLPNSDAAHCHDPLEEPLQRFLKTLEDRLADNTQTPVPEQAEFRIDFPAWLRTLSVRERTMAEAMMREERTNDLSKKFGVSPGRISQLRSKLRTEWASFCGEEA
jgi:hypothetical protein